MSDVVSALQRALSKPRLDRYSSATQGDLPKALELYAANMRVSAAITNLIHVFEIVVRNRMDQALRNGLAQDWLLQLARAGLRYKALNILKATDKLGILTYRPTDAVIRHAVASYQQSQKSGVVSVDQNALVANVPFGFWATLLKPQYEGSLWRVIFSGAFQGITHQELFSATDKLARLRNRLAHHEPFIFRQSRSVKVSSHAEIVQIIYLIRNVIRDIEPVAFCALEKLLDTSVLFEEIAEALGIDYDRIQFGTLERFEPEFGHFHVACDAFSESLYCSRAAVPAALWDHLEPDRDVQFVVTYREDGRPIVESLLNVLPRDIYFDEQGRAFETKVVPSTIADQQSAMTSTSKSQDQTDVHA